MKLHGLYGITDADLLPGNRLVFAVEQAIEGGMRLVQYRNKKGTSSERFQEASALVACCRQYDIPILINDDIELCRRVGAQGVHLGQSDDSLQTARAALGSEAIIGITCHNSLSLALKAEKGGASYIALGRFFPSATKSSAPPCEIDTLSHIRQQITCPIVAIGGITFDLAQPIIAKGADMIAVCHYLFAADNIAQRARRLSSLFT